MTGTTGAAGSTGTPCPHRGRPDDAEPSRVVSRHGTAAGGTPWTRCGSPRGRALDDRGARVLSPARPAGVPRDRTGR
ncbi:hypothetical protein [Streptomyces sp. NPDC016626]|uniref:hypothetical protein n=1 Tax=Streptomyces sp. NPDC016626 TaxID=3364968 RepID=UPI0036F8C9EF